MDIEKCFTDDGDLNFDPYRREYDHPKYMAIFDGGMLKCGVSDKLKKMVKSHGWSPWCEAVGIVHAEQMADGTKGNYTTIYYFR